MSQDAINLSRKQFTTMVSMFAGLAGYPNPDDPLPDGPWDPVIRESILRLLTQLGPQPDPWRDMHRQIGASLNWAALNPQPLPPRWLWANVAAQAIVADIQHTTALLQLLPEEFQERAAEGIRMNLAQLVDDWCGTGRPKWPFPVPPFPWPPEPEPDPRELFVNPLDLMVMGVVFDNLAGLVADGLQDALKETAVAFQDAGLAGMG